MHLFTDQTSTRQIENQCPWSERPVAETVYDALCTTAATFGDRPGISFQILAEPGSKSETLTWSQLLKKTTQAANLFRHLGIGETDVVAYLMPNANETVLALLGGMTAGQVAPINPLLDVEQIAGILNETGAKVLVTLKSMPKSDVAQKAAAAAAFAPGLKTVLEVDLNRYLAPPEILDRAADPAQDKVAPSL